jgi:hypothetical protein
MISHCRRLRAGFKGSTGLYQGNRQNAQENQLEYHEQRGLTFRFSGTFGSRRVEARCSDATAAQAEWRRWRISVCPIRVDKAIDSD